MANKQDEQVQALFNVVQQKKAEIAKTEKPSWKTNCAFRYNPNIPAIDANIQAITKVAELLEIAAFLIEKESAYQKANEALGTDVKFKWLGYSLEEWMADIKTRVNSGRDIKEKRRA